LEELLPISRHTPCLENHVYSKVLENYKMSLFDELDACKKNGKRLQIQDLNRNELKQLFFDESVSDNRMAELFGVNRSKVTYLRRKFGITLKKLIPEDLIMYKSDSALKENLAHKDEVFNKDNIDIISKAITHFVFRNGPIEDMHADQNSKLTDDDMRKLNVYMVNRIAAVFNVIMSNRWYEFEFLINTYSLYSRDWDKAKIDDADIIMSINRILNTTIRSEEI
jgi:hypothetical protein